MDGLRQAKLLQVLNGLFETKHVLNLDDAFVEPPYFLICFQLERIAAALERGNEIAEQDLAARARIEAIAGRSVAAAERIAPPGADPSRS